MRVINLSLGRRILESYTKDPLCQAVERAWAAGTVVVVAAGNRGRDNSLNTNGHGTIGSPGNDPYVLTVGAMRDMGTPSRTDDLVASYSSKGPTNVDKIVKPDLVAPGNRIIAAQRSAVAGRPSLSGFVDYDGVVVDSGFPATSILSMLFPTNIVATTEFFTNIGNQRGLPSAWNGEFMELSGTSMAAPWSPAPPPSSSRSSAPPSPPTPSKPNS
ncbi:MAG: S8 family serine peptidase [Acidobacteria bacterium]|nr:S8 family serine peptidase [Bryobacteraceae bacterium CoA2 C42]